MLRQLAKCSQASSALTQTKNEGMTRRDFGANGFLPSADAGTFAIARNVTQL